MNAPLRRRPHRRRRLIVAFVLLVTAAGAAVAVYVHHRLRPGSEFHAGVSFVPSERPGSRPAPSSVPWPLYGYSKDHDRYYPAPAALRPPFRRLWTFGGKALLEFPPVIDAGLLFQLDDAGVLHAIVAASGKLAWQRQLGSLAASTPAVGGDTVYATLLRGRGGSGRVVALSLENGSIRWSRRLESPTESSPLLDRGKLYLGSQDGTVYAFNAHSGRVLWRYRAPGAVKASPTLEDGRLYFGDYGGHMQALVESTGRRLWITGGKGLLGGGNFYSTPAAAFGRVFAGNTDGRVYGFAARTGRLAWAHQTGAYVYSSPAVDDTPGLGPTVYVGSYDGRFYALSAFSGSVRWSFNAHGRISGSPTVLGRIVYFANLADHQTYGLDVETGRVLYQRDAGSFDPVVSDGKRVYMTGYSALYGFVPAHTRAVARRVPPSRPHRHKARRHRIRRRRINNHRRTRPHHRTRRRAVRKPPRQSPRPLLSQRFCTNPFVRQRAFCHSA